MPGRFRWLFELFFWKMIGTREKRIEVRGIFQERTQPSSNFLFYNLVEILVGCSDGPGPRAFCFFFL